MARQTKEASNKTPIDSPTGYEWVPTDELYFDPKNPRLVEHVDGEKPDQEKLLRILWENMAVDELAMSIAASGYFDYEPLFATLEHGRLVVIEGNRRLAAVKLLLSDEARKNLRATDLPKISAARRKSLMTLPVIRTDRRSAWQYLGFKHVNGPAKWDSYAKAQYIAHIHNDFGVPLDDIAEQIGDRHRTVQRLYRALMVIDQAEEADIFHRDNRYKRHFGFSHLYTGLDYDGISTFLNLRPESIESRKPVPANRLKNLQELCLWLYGDKSLDLRPIVESQNPDLRQLDEVLKNQSAVKALRAGLPLNLALEVSYGDEVVFQNALIRAKENLQKARATLTTGFDGEEDLLRTANIVSEIALDLVDEMERVRKGRRRRKPKSE